MKNVCPRMTVFVLTPPRTARDARRTRTGPRTGDTLCAHVLELRQREREFYWTCVSEPAQTRTRPGPKKLKRRGRAVLSGAARNA
jgi:hypothetical protein